MNVGWSLKAFADILETTTIIPSIEDDTLSQWLLEIKANSTDLIYRKLVKYFYFYCGCTAFDNFRSNDILSDDVAVTASNLLDAYIDNRYPIDQRSEESTIVELEYNKFFDMSYKVITHLIPYLNRFKDNIISDSIVGIITHVDEKQNGIFVFFIKEQKIIDGFSYLLDEKSV